LKDAPTAAGFGISLDLDDPDAEPTYGWDNDGAHMIDDDFGMPMDGNFVDDEEPKARKPLTDEQKLLCTPIVRGYSLHDKEWLNFFVNSLQDIVFNTRAFESLVLPGDEKELILGFASTPEIYRRQFDDVVEGKGRGMVILLCGPPGTGKTLTAEGVAEEMKTPLYVMSAGDLGLDPRHVETKLQGVLDICTRWNAILLLDEADVFLEERSLHELERNKLVSIFLRVLEYYDGNMILTTNRVQTFDPAFQSRILISIDYKELTVESRRTVWANFLKQHDSTQTAARAKVPEGSGEDDKESREQHLKRTLPHEISQADLDNLARTLTLNGRQIKNVLKTAQLLALRRGEGLNKEHIKLVLKVTQHLHNSTREKESTRSAIFN
jgi:SpoVK/Ycf46/Vps4 family AAA+-type ATPase